MNETFNEHYTESVEVLGIIVNEKDDQMIDENILPVLEKIKIILDTWKIRGLSLIGKILVCNSLVSSLLIYKMSVLPLLPQSIYKNFERLLLDFIWDGKRAKIPMEILQGEKLQGGLGLFDIRKKDLALKINWIVRIQKSKAFQDLAYEELENKIGDLIWKSQLREQDVKLYFKNRNFWTDVLKAWSALTFDGPTSPEQVKKQILWLNSNIQVGGVPVCWLHWTKKKVLSR